MNSNREKEDSRFKSQYKPWKSAVLKRDKNRCQMPGCGYKRALQIHHILSWADYPSLRFSVDNGITLCYKCHKSIWKNERLYVSLFRDIIRGKK